MPSCASTPQRMSQVFADLEAQDFGKHHVEQAPGQASPPSRNVQSGRSCPDGSRQCPVNSSCECGRVRKALRLREAPFEGKGGGAILKHGRLGGCSRRPRAAKSVVKNTCQDICMYHSEDFSGFYGTYGPSLRQLRAASANDTAANCPSDFSAPDVGASPGPK